MRESDFAARAGGDEFVVVQTHTRHADKVEATAQRFMSAIAAPFIISRLEIHISGSIDNILSSKYGTDIDNLVAGADKAS